MEFSGWFSTFIDIADLRDPTKVPNSYYLPTIQILIPKSQTFGAQQNQISDQIQTKKQPRGKQLDENNKIPIKLSSVPRACGTHWIIYLSISNIVLRRTSHSAVHVYSILIESHPQDSLSFYTDTYFPCHSENYLPL